MNIFFLNPQFFILLPLAALFFLFALKKRRGQLSAVNFTSGTLLSGLQGSFKLVLSRHMIYLRGIVFLLIILALGRPQSPVADSRIQSEGIDIVLAIDCSTSMLAEDFKIAGKRQNRLDVVKTAVGEFIKARKNDRISLVAFAARPYTICPLTLDYGWLMTNLERIKSGMVEDGTAVGSGIAASLNRLRDSKAKSKIVVLLTDGRNNTGKIAPITAAEAASALKIKIYTIGAGSRGPVPYPTRDFFGNTVYQSVEIDLDEDTLMKISSITGARYFRATDTERLKGIYKEIDAIEKTPVEERGYLEYKELFPYFLILALVLLFLEIILSNTILRAIP